MPVFFVSAGLPTTTVCGSTSRSTTDPAPTTALAPSWTPGFTTAPAPMNAPRPTRTPPVSTGSRACAHGLIAWRGVPPQPPSRRHHRLSSDCAHALLPPTCGSLMQSSRSGFAPDCGAMSLVAPVSRSMPSRRVHVTGSMFWFTWKRLPGSYFVLTSTSRS